MVPPSFLGAAVVLCLVIERLRWASFSPGDLLTSYEHAPSHLRRHTRRRPFSAHGCSFRWSPVPCAFILSDTVLALRSPSIPSRQMGLLSAPPAPTRSEEHTSE